MQRRQFLKTTGLVTAGVLLSRTGLFAGSDDRPPNLIVVMADDLGDRSEGDAAQADQGQQERNNEKPSPVQSTKSFALASRMRVYIAQGVPPSYLPNRSYPARPTVVRRRLQRPRDIVLSSSLRESNPTRGDRSYRRTVRPPLVGPRTGCRS